MQRIGVFVCHCGTNIAATVDVEKVVEAVKNEPGVVHAEDYQYMCSEAGQSKIQDAIREKHLTGVVVCSCSPRMHENTFRKAVEKAGLNPYMLEIANIREHCSWIHKNREEATEKAIILARAAVAKVHLNAPLQPGESRVVKRALVIGGGIAGIQTALDIADAGYEVDIVEKTPSIGGKMSQLDKTFPTLDCSACILTPKMVEASAHERINLYTYSEVEKVSGFVGDFKVDIRKKARSVDMSKCTGCGVCSQKCPSKKTPSEFNRGLGTRSAIYTPFAQAIPNVPVIDREHCIKFQTGKCGLCAKVCAAGAIDYTQEDEIITREYGAIVVATGFDMINTASCGGEIAALLSALDETNECPKTIIYSLNPADNEQIGTILGCFQSSEVPGKIQHGSAWWFNDQKIGMENQMKSLANLGLLGNFVGMLTDSRSFLSYTRHDYFRRILCNLIGQWVEDGEYPNDEKTLEKIVRGICFDNAKRYFNL